MLSMVAAIKYLTIFSWPRDFRSGAQSLGRSAIYFPLVGLFLGVILVLFARLLDPYLASEVLSAVLVSALVVLTRGLHLEGLAESWDRLRARRSVVNDLDTAGNHGVGIFGLLAVLLIVALKFRAVEVMGDARGSGLLLAPALGRWAMVVLAYGSTPSAIDGERSFLEYVRGKQLVLSTVLVLVLAVLFGRRFGLWIALCVSVLALLARQFLHRRLGGVSEGNLGAICEMSEALALVLFATF